MRPQRSLAALALAAGAAALNDGPRPCDILAAAGTPCVAAHSTVRALYAGYTGALYNVTRASDGKSLSVPVLNSGFANKAQHDAFCHALDCVISNVFDQSPNGNHLGQRHKLVNASQHPITVSGGVPVYGMWFDPGFGYHVDKTVGIAKGSDPESIYAVLSGTHFNGGASAHRVTRRARPLARSPVRWRASSPACLPASSFARLLARLLACSLFARLLASLLLAHRPLDSLPPHLAGCCFDYGNSESNDRDDGDGTMEAIYFGTGHWRGNTGAGSGPWVGADLEQGMYYGGGLNQTVQNLQNTPLTTPFVTTYLRGYTDAGFMLKGGDATAGTLKTMYVYFSATCGAAGRTCFRCVLHH